MPRVNVLWTARDAAAATGGEATTDWQATGVSIDTRTLQPGDLFVALKVARDGHDFVARALEAGAAAALVTYRPEGVAGDAPLLIVEDVQEALEALGRAGRARTGARVLAITGSVGKTSTKDMAAAVFSAQGRTHAAVASYNNHWGVPLTLARMPADTEFAVIEIGMNAPGEIAPLSAQARPHAAIVTTVAAAHLEAFHDRGGLDGIAREKASIFSGLEPGGTAILNGDLPTSALLRAAAPGPAVAFGEGAANDIRLEDIRVQPGATVGQGRDGDTPFLLKVGCEGRHFAVNALAVLAAVTALGGDMARALMTLAAWTPPAGRGLRETVQIDAARSGESLELLDDAFNANPTSMVAAFAVLAAATPRDGVGRIVKGRRIAILGDMLELGPDETALHAGLARDPAVARIDMVHCVGPRMRALHAALDEDRRGLWRETPEELIAEIAGLVDSGDVVLVKGSKGSYVSRVVDAIRKLGVRGATPTPAKGQEA